MDRIHRLGDLPCLPAFRPDMFEQPEEGIALSDLDDFDFVIVQNIVLIFVGALFDYGGVWWQRVTVSGLIKSRLA